MIEITTTFDNYNPVDDYSDEYYSYTEGSFDYKGSEGLIIGDILNYIDRRLIPDVESYIDSESPIMVNGKPVGMIFNIDCPNGKVTPPSCGDTLPTLVNRTNTFGVIDIQYVSKDIEKNDSTDDLWCLYSEKNYEHSISWYFGEKKADTCVVDPYDEHYDWNITIKHTNKVLDNCEQNMWEDYCDGSSDYDPHTVFDISWMSCYNESQIEELKDIDSSWEEDEIDNAMTDDLWQDLADVLNRCYGGSGNNNSPVTPWHEDEEDDGSICGVKMVSNEEVVDEEKESKMALLRLLKDLN